MDPFDIHKVTILTHASYFLDKGKNSQFRKYFFLASKNNSLLEGTKCCIRNHIWSPSGLKTHYAQIGPRFKTLRNSRRWGSLGQGTVNGLRIQHSPQGKLFPIKTRSCKTTDNIKDSLYLDLTSSLLVQHPSLKKKSSEKRNQKLRNCS